MSDDSSKLLAIIANLRGAKDALEFEEIDYLGFPFSISENFQMRNTHKTIEDSLDMLEKIINLVDNKNKKLVVYLSMGFGNPYGDSWSVDIVANWVDRLYKMGVNIVSLSDTVGSSTPEDIKYLYSNLIPDYPKIEFGAHLHTTIGTWYEKMDAAYKSGCRRFDGAIKGYGGCPMATDELTGNMPTEKILTYFLKQKVEININSLRFESAYNIAVDIFKNK